MELNTKKIGKLEWEKYWAGNWSLFTASYFGYYYTNMMKSQLGEGLTRVIILSHKGYSACFFEKEDRQKFGNYLAQKAIRDEDFTPKFCKELKKKADSLVNMVKELKKKDVDKKEFQKFLNAFYDYTGLHITPRHIVDYLSKKELDRLLPYYSDVRLYTEKVFAETEKFMQSFAEKIGKKTGYPAHLMLCLVREELDDYFKTGKLLSKEELQNRFEASALVFDKKEYKLFSGDKVEDIEDALFESEKEGQISGSTAYPGKVVGKVRVIFDPKKVKKFNKGDILVTGMTRPEFLPLIKKATAVVTDSGGILSHAAIVSRELKIPTVIGTKIATKVLKDGDKVEVDASKGIIKKIK